MQLLPRIDLEFPTLCFRQLFLFSPETEVEEKGIKKNYTEILFVCMST